MITILIFSIKLEVNVHESLFFSTGSEKEREVYRKAGRRVTQPTNEKAEPVRLKLNVKHARPVFGTDFDVITEVSSAQTLTSKGDKLSGLI